MVLTGHGMLVVERGVNLAGNNRYDGHTDQQQSNNLIRFGLHN
jgi:hypothetical protein